ncbi:MAG: DM13 domain-containing protein [Pseudomonadota bacterium]
MGKLIRMLITHGIALAVGFGLGVYFLPILTAPPSPDNATLEEMAAGALYTTELLTDLPGNDFIHWGEGTISVSATEVTHQGELAPGPDYKLYLTQGLVDHEDTFDRAKAVQIGDIQSFGGFIVTVPEGVDVEAYDSILVWCEAFGEFITAATYK